MKTIYVTKDTKYRIDERLFKNKTYCINICINLLLRVITNFVTTKLSYLTCHV